VEGVRQLLRLSNWHQVVQLPLPGPVPQQQPASTTLQALMKCLHGSLAWSMALVRQHLSNPGLFNVRHADRPGHWHATHALLGDFVVSLHWKSKGTGVLCIQRCTLHRFDGDSS
jgi:hypothetical protein